MRFIAAATIASSFISTVLAVACNPLTTGGCPPDPALGTSFREDFQSDAGPYFTVLKKAGTVEYGNDGISLTIKERFDNPSFQSNFYIMFGKVEVVMQAAEGTGIISSFYLQSDDLDEIDIELFGGDGYEFQSNYFVKGNTATYDRGEYHPTSSNPLENFHTYTIEWTEDQLTWSLDGNVVRTITKDNAQGYPQSPMQIFAGTWAGGDPGNEQGTIEWAGGLTDYADAPFTMKIKSIIVSDYSTGESYSYTDQSGTWQSIEAKNGKVNGREQQGQADFATLQSGGNVDSKVNSLIAESDSDTTTSSTTTSSTSSTTSSTSTTSSSTTTTSSSSTTSTSSSKTTSSSTSSTSTTTSTTEHTTSTEETTSVEETTSSEEETTSTAEEKNTSTEDETSSETTAQTTETSATEVSHPTSSTLVTSVTTSKTEEASISETSASQSVSTVREGNAGSVSVPFIGLISVVASFLLV
ncbi:concanavalin A-like lectin/glucanase domain-containing protein [Scheffersomyces xylosifermentans]|uniref:concanavalin A-like lectin/glucanase domain-containing protein n=1 Tax=Scheffersomyces xylosifermentans TaxID=1304137 RepID=UPI00315C69D6